MIPICKGKGDIITSGMYSGVKLLEHAMDIVEKVLDKSLRKIVTIDDMQFGSMSRKGTNDAVFNLTEFQGMLWNGQ